MHFHRLFQLAWRLLLASVKEIPQSDRSWISIQRLFFFVSRTRHMEPLRSYPRTSAGEWSCSMLWKDTSEKRTNSQLFNANICLLIPSDCHFWREETTERCYSCSSRTPSDTCPLMSYLRSSLLYGCEHWVQKVRLVAWSSGSEALLFSSHEVFRSLIKYSSMTCLHSGDEMSSNTHPSKDDWRQGNNEPSTWNRCRWKHKSISLVEKIKQGSSPW